MIADLIPPSINSPKSDALKGREAQSEARPETRKPWARLHLWGDFALLALMVMEAFWITDWYDTLVRPRAGWAAVDLSLVLVLVLSHLLARGIAHFHLGLGLRRFVFIAWIALVLLCTLWLVVYAGERLTLAELGQRIIVSFAQFGSDLREFWHLLILILVVYRGLTLAREPLQVYQSQSSFQLGLFLLLIYGLLFGWEKSSQAIITTYGFLFCAIIEMSAARISTLSELRGGRLPPLKAGWFWGIIAIAGIIVGAAVTVGWFSTNIAADVLTIAYTAIFTVAIVLGLIVLSPVLLLILALGPTIRDLLTALSNLRIFDNLFKFVQSVAESAGITPEWIAGVAKVGRPTLLFSVLVGVLIWVLVAVVWKPWQRRLSGEENTNTLPLRAALQFPRLFLRRLSGRLPSGGRLLAAARIRWVYAQLMDLSTRLGKPRPPSATPLEFLPALQSLFSGEENTLAAITQAYLKVRYGELPETYEEVQQVLLGWDRLKIQGSRALTAHKRRKSRPR